MPRGLREFQRRQDLHDTVERLLHEAHLALMDGASAVAMAHVQGAIHMAEDLGALTPMEARGWIDAIQHCPENTEADPGHMGGRGWCAYCDNIQRPEDEGGLPVQVGAWQITQADGTVVQGTSGTLDITPTPWRPDPKVYPGTCTCDHSDGLPPGSRQDCEPGCAPCFASYCDAYERHERSG